ncbi:MAG: DEAD/DEAH box helicase [Vicingaceae bacterium]|nr:DEAD/DEAH box helicase [Vicingaceae bacterium]
MNVELLRKYMRENTTQQTRNRASSLAAKLVEIDSDSAVFECQGNAYEPYEITINANDKYTEAECTCPYNYAGICKHSLASIRELIRILDEDTEKKASISNVSDKLDSINPHTQKLLAAIFGENDLEILEDKTINKNSTSKTLFQLPPPTRTKVIKNELALPNNEITKELLSELDRKIVSYYYYSDKVSLTKVTPNLVESKSGGWKSNVQSLVFDREKSILTFNCDCSNAKNICRHSADAFALIYNNFGNDFFKANYLDNFISEHLAKFNLTLQDDYQKFFTYELTPKGVEIKSPYKNITNSIKTFQFYDKTETEDIALLPYLQKKDDLNGLGFVFEFSSKNFSGLFPVYAKFNKDKSDFASSFKIITHNNYGYANELPLYKIENQEEQVLALKTIQFDYLKIKVTNKLNVSDLKQGINTFQQLATKINDFFIYEYNPKKTLTRKNLSKITVSEQPITLFFTLTESKLFYTLKAKLSVNETTHNLGSSTMLITPFFVKIKDVIYPISSSDLSVSMLHFANQPETNYIKKDIKEIYENIILPLSKKYEVQSTIFKKQKKQDVTFTEDTLEKHVYITDLDGEFILFKPIVSYNDKLISLFSNELLTTETDKNSIQYTNRNQAYEDNFLEELKVLHPDFENQTHFFYLTPEQLFENYWMLHATERMKQLGIKVFGANELKSFKYNLNKPTINVSIASQIDWFDVAIDISFGNQKVTLKDVQKAIIKKSNYITLGDGTIGILPEEWMKKFSNYFKVGEIKKNAIQLSNYQFGIIEELYQEIETKPAFLEELYQKKQRLQNLSKIESILIPKEIKANLRDYQQHGLNWLTFLDTNKLGGCLADDMGLGKTLQAITFLMHLKKTKKDIQPSLIIAPTSLIFNWKNEINKFAPSLKAMLFIGNNRKELQDKFNGFDVIVSTYGALLNDIVFLQDYQFNYVILDESQAIKNPQSKRYKAVRLLKAYNRLVLTGTPIENNTFDLYAQFNFLNPGLLGSMSHFKTEFSNAIDKEKDIETSKLLSNIVSPFILRRTKEQVATELPAKTEEIIYCEMSKEQRSVYENFKNKYRDYLLNKIDENGAEKSQMYVLEGLTKLRLICNSTALINEEEDYGNISVKLETLIEIIKDKTGTHKILVFSQFVKMLQLIKTRLEEEKIEYEYLDGQTTNREEKVNNFQENTDVRVFLISLKAGGTGLNLTKADYVFIIDPWWNPAVENQAIDRCYRIGQTQNVMAYRMICKDSIEEKIIQLQQKKKTVAANVIQIDETAKKSFDAKQIKELFS